MLSRKARMKHLPDNLDQDTIHKLATEEYLDTSSPNALIWHNTIGTVIASGIQFSIKDEKPQFSFSYITMHYEPRLHNAFYMTDIKYIDESGEERTRLGNKYMTEDEIKEVEAYCISFLDTADYQVWAYEPDTLFYTGPMLKSIAIKKNYKYTIKSGPKYEASRYDPDTESWIQLRATILDDGTLNVNPNYICDRCVLGLTDEEFNKFPRRPKDTYKWDFQTESWKDTRDLDETKYKAKLAVKSLIEAVRWKVSGQYTTQFEQFTWMIQLQEARDYLADPEHAITPYIDTFLKKRVDKYIPTKEELCNDILNNNKEFIELMAELSAIQWAFLKNIQYAESTEDVDKYEKEANIWSNTKLRMLGSKAARNVRDIINQDIHIQPLQMV